MFTIDRNVSKESLFFFCPRALHTEYKVNLRSYNGKDYLLPYGVLRTKDTSVRTPHSITHSSLDVLQLAYALFIPSRVNLDCSVISRSIYKPFSMDGLEQLAFQNAVLPTQGKIFRSNSRYFGDCYIIRVCRESDYDVLIVSLKVLVGPRAMMMGFGRGKTFLTRL